MSVYYLTLDDYLAIAVAVTGQSVKTLVIATNSALHAPSASFAGEEFYPDFVDKAAVLAMASGAWDEDVTAEWLRPKLRRRQE